MGKEGAEKNSRSRISANLAGVVPKGGCEMTIGSGQLFLIFVAPVPFVYVYPILRVLVPSFAVWLCSGRADGGKFQEISLQAEG